MNSSIQKNNILTVKDLVVLSLISALMFCSKIALSWLPNVHLVGMLIIVTTVIYRSKALLSIYVFVFLCGLFEGFYLWWIPYLYVWTVLWAFVMILPKNMSKNVSLIVFPIVCALHGLLFGTLYAPAQALMFGFDFKQTIAWIVAGLYFDLIHGISNFFVGMLIYPTIVTLKKIIKN